MLHMRICQSERGPGQYNMLPVRGPQTLSGDGQAEYEVIGNKTWAAMLRKEQHVRCLTAMDKSAQAAAK